VKRKTAKNSHTGSTIDRFLKDEGIFAEVSALVAKEKIAFQLKKRMEAEHISVNRMAREMRTSRTQVHRLLDPKNGNVTLATLQKAAAVVGRTIRLELV
jgi:antitoxin HicB